MPAIDQATSRVERVFRFSQHHCQLLHFDAAAHGSMLQDLKMGRRLEVESLNGTVVRLGQEVGLPTPLNFAIYAALKAYAEGPPAMPV
jgi:2-dehydropantoate 2-reductase